MSVRKERVLVVPNGFERNYTLGLIRGLVANGLNLLVLSCDETTPALASAGIPHVNVRGSVSTNRSRLRKVVNMLRYYFRMFWLLTVHWGAAVHFSGIFQNRRVVFDGLILNWYFRITSRRYVYTVHNVLPHSREHSRFFRWIYRQVYRAPHVLLVHTEHARRQLIEEFRVPPAKIHLTSIGLNEEVPVSGLTRESARLRVGLKDGEQGILFFGKIDEYKGLDTLLDAFEQIQVPGARLVVAGSFRNDEYRTKILRQLERMTRKADVRLHESFIPNEEVEIYFKASDVLCLPYRNIYQSGLIFLAPRFGIPIVATDVAAMRDFLGPKLGILSRTNDAPGIAAALEDFFQRRAEFRSEEIFANAERFRWDRICGELLPLYHL